jgi:hypothetical protein
VPIAMYGYSVMSCHAEGRGKCNVKENQNKNNKKKKDRATPMEKAMMREKNEI